MDQALKIKQILKGMRKLATPYSSSGKVVGINGGIIEAEIPMASIGDICTINSRTGSVDGKVVSFSKSKTLIAPFSHTAGVGPASKVTSKPVSASISIPKNPLGCVLDALGNPRHLSKSQEQTFERQLYSDPPNPLDRKVIDKPLITGVAAIDSLCTIGKGQRIGLLAAPGVGKSTLLGMIAKNTEVDVTVIALVGERGREVNEFIEDILGEEGLAKCVLVVTTSDESPMRRSLAAATATSIAEMYRTQGKDVLLLVDSITRTARAIRDVSLIAGELPVRQGYTPSVYSELPRLFERAGNDNKGSITAIYTVLTNGEEEEDPLAEEVKSLLDGHICLSRNIASSGIRPAIDIRNSVSRVMNRVTNCAHQRDSDFLRKIICRLLQDKDLVAFGGTPDAELRAALEAEQELTAFLNQVPSEKREFDETLLRLEKISATVQAKIHT